MHMNKIFKNNRELVICLYQHRGMDFLVGITQFNVSMDHKVTVANYEEDSFPDNSKNFTFSEFLIGNFEN